MTNGNNAAQGKHLESLATATKRYILAQILDVTDAVSSELENASGSGVLDTVPATINGGMWYELDSGVPRYIKLKHGDHTLSLTPSIVNISPGLTVTPAATTVPADGSITANVSFNGNGNITVTSDTINPTYNATTKTITVPYSYDVASATITVELSAGYGYLADSTTFNVTMAKASPNLTVTPSANTTDGDDITASVSYSGGGTLSVSSDNANVTPTISGSTITVPYHAFTDADTTVTITVSVSANGNYNAQSSTFSVLFEKSNNPQLTITPASTTLNLVGTTASVTRNGSGAITVSSDNENVTPTISGSTITIPYAVFDEDTDVTFTVNVAPSSGYIADEKSFTVTYVSPLVVYMPFDTSMTQDLCGNTWVAYGDTAKEDKIVDKQLSIQFNGGIGCTELELGGQSFSVEFFTTPTYSSSNMSVFYITFTTSTVQIKSTYQAFRPGINDTLGNYEGLNSVSNEYHYAVVYNYPAKRVYWFVNGILKHTATVNLSREVVNIGLGTFYRGRFDDFKVYDGVALHTANFTPPTRPT